MNCDGAVDAIGLGGIDLYFYISARRYTLRDAARLARQAYITPVVDGSGLKQSLEKRVIRELDSVLRWRGKRVLMVSALDRYGMAVALEEAGAKVLYGDADFRPRFARSGLRHEEPFAEQRKTLLPLLSPNCLSPGSIRQVTSKIRGRAQRLFTLLYDWADVIAGDWHFIRRYLPERVDGKVSSSRTRRQKKTSTSCVKEVQLRLSPPRRGMTGAASQRTL